MKPRTTVTGRPGPSAAVTKARLRRRHAAERRFRAYAIAAVGVAVGLLALLVVSIGSRAYSGFRQTYVTLPVLIDREIVDPQATGDPAVLADANYLGLVKQALRTRFPEVAARSEQAELYALVSMSAADAVKAHVLARPQDIGGTVEFRFETSDKVDALAKGRIDRELPPEDRGLSDLQMAWADDLRAKDELAIGFSRTLLTSGDSREPERAGILAALTGSAMTLAVTFLLSFPLGVAAAVYLEEFAPKNRWTSLIEVNINNLAAVPSVIFGLLGLAILLNFFGLPRSSPMAGGIVLALMTLPTLIIAARAAISAVPPSIREAALARRCLRRPGGPPSRRAAGDAGNSHRQHHRHGPRSRRDGAVADDRHGGLHRRRSQGLHRSGHRAAGADLHLGRQPRARASWRARPRRRWCCCPSS